MSKNLNSEETERGQVRVEMGVSDTEREVQARVNFKLNEILRILENRVGITWQIAFNKGSQKHAYYWEAFKELKFMFENEAHLPLPADDVAQKNKRQKRDKAVSYLSERLLDRGDRQYRSKINSIVKAIEEAQNW